MRVQKILSSPSILHLLTSGNCDAAYAHTGVARSSAIPKVFLTCCITVLNISPTAHMPYCNKQIIQTL